MIEILSPAPGIPLEDLWYILAQLLIINLVVLVINIIVVLMLIWKLKENEE